MSDIGALADAVYLSLQKPFMRFGRNIVTPRSPSVETLNALFTSLFFASIKTEEGRSIQVRAFYIDPDDPDPDEPRRVRMDRWRVYNLSERFPFNVANIVKFAKAADPWSSGVAVFHDEAGELFAWALVDQISAISMAFVREGPPTYDPPGLFQCLVGGPADISVYRRSSFVARLAQNTLLISQNDCLGSGPVSERIDEWFSAIWEDVALAAGKRDLAHQRNYFRFLGKQMWTSTLCRILLNIQRQRHGGAILFTNSGAVDLSPKYAVNYPRIGEALREILYATIRSQAAHLELEFRRVNEDRKVSKRIHDKQILANAGREDADAALTGAVRFISSMAGVDGLVLATSELSILGFGVEITAKSDVQTIFVTNSPAVDDLKKIDVSHYGTRHRSMFRYISKHPGSLGFVVSQDGDVRVVMSLDRQVVVFENLKLHALWDDDFQKLSDAMRSKKRIRRKRPNDPPR